MTKSTRATRNGWRSVVRGRIPKPSLLLLCDRRARAVYEEKLPEGYRHHKGSPLYNWGIFLLRQNIPDLVAVGLEKVSLAFIEDLLDYNTHEQALNAPASMALNQFTIAGDLIQRIIITVRNLVEANEIPKDPIEVLNAAREEEGISLTDIGNELEQAKKVILDWVKEKGDKQKRVFLGGSYRNIAVLKKIAQIVENLGYIPIMAYECQQLSAFKDHINATSIMLLEECSHAIFEITMSRAQ